MAESRVYHTLDGLRGVAALSIVVLHSPELWGGSLMGSAGLAVDLFFALSGFVICHAYDKRFAAGMTVGEFMRIRIIRLYPLYLLGTFLGIAVIGGGLLMFGSTGNWTWNEFLRAIPASLLMLPTPFPGELYPLNVVAWSLFFELIANLIYAAFWAQFQKKAVLYGWLAVSAVALIAGTIVYRDLEAGPKWPAIAGAARVAWGFWIGVLIYRLHKTVRLNAVVPWLLLAALPVLFNIHYETASAAQILVEIICAGVILPVIVALGASFETTAGAKVFRFLGLTSYAVYVLHKPLVIAAFSIVEKVLHLKLAPPITPWIGVGFLIAILLGAWIADMVYDAPVRRWLTRVTRKAPQPATA